MIESQYKTFLRITTVMELNRLKIRWFNKIENIGDETRIRRIETVAFDSHNFYFHSVHARVPQGSVLGSTSLFF